MRYTGLTFALLAPVLFAGPAFAQQATALPPAVAAERDAGNVALLKAETLLNNEEERGPNSEACALMNQALLHYVRTAAAAGAKIRVLDWPALTLEEQAAIGGKIDRPFDRNDKLRLHACTARRL
jgi:hypothetical protein